MQADHYAAMRATEDTHWWYTGNRAVVQRLLAGRLPAGARSSLDAGCGTGRNLQWHAELAAATGLDYEPLALQNCADRGHRRLVRGSIAELPFADDTFDLVTCFEVMYHELVTDWQAVVRGYARVLKPGGLLLLREPAFPFLFGSHDRVVHGARRFRRRQLRDAVVAAGLEIERCSYQNVVTFFPALLLRSWERLRGSKPQSAAGDLEHGAGTGLVQRLLGGALALEGRWLRFARLPVGSSVLCLARKPN
jgi:SAM-dependent methyltransferase